MVLTNDEWFTKWDVCCKTFCDNEQAYHRGHHQWWQLCGHNFSGKLSILRSKTSKFWLICTFIGLGLILGHGSGLFVLDFDLCPCILTLVLGSWPLAWHHIPWSLILNNGMESWSLVFSLDSWSWIFYLCTLEMVDTWGTFQ